MELYSKLSEYYFDIEKKSRDFGTDISFIKGYGNSALKPAILDLGCGSGEHLKKFAEYGYSCTGIDVSKDMLSIARSRNSHPNINYIHSNMTDFDYYEEFDLIVSLFGSIDYLLNDKDIDSVLWNCWRALKSSGYGIFEVWNSDPLLKIKEKELSHTSTTSAYGARINRERGFKISSKSPLLVDVFYRYHFSKNGELELIEDKHTMRAFHRAEFEKFILDNGFNVIDVFSGYDKSKYHTNSNKMIFVFQKI